MLLTIPICIAGVERELGEALRTGQRLTVSQHECGKDGTEGPPYGPPFGRGTPLADLGSPRLQAKIEWMNPSGSIKDRAALWMVKEALESGLLDSGKVIIEPSSGNMGIALASAAQRLGLRAEIVVPEKVSAETKEMLKGLGAAVLETADDLCPRVGKGTDQCIALAGSLQASKPELYYMPNQYENMANFRAHYNSTGPEIWRDTRGKVDVFVAGVGTGGTITGVAKYLKEKKAVKVIAVQPQPEHKVQGLRNMSESQMPKVLQEGASLIDEWVTVTNDEAFDGVRRLASDLSIFAGPSSAVIRWLPEGPGAPREEGGDDVRRLWPEVQVSLSRKRRLQRPRNGEANAGKLVQ